VRSAVYILQNAEADRVKVGMTTNDVSLRLQEVNDTWLEHRLTCQICGTRRLAKPAAISPRRMPKHSSLGRECPGGNQPPLEWDTTLARSHLDSMKASVARGDKVSLTRQIRTLEQRIERRSQHTRALGYWVLDTVIPTERALEVERRAHELLAAHLDTTAPLGEVFRCSVAEAKAALDRALHELP